ncbi:MAG: hypothetical protein AAGC72_07620 [Planctomycetota bacterium]
MTAIRTTLNPPSEQQLQRYVVVVQHFNDEMEQALLESLVALENELKFNLLRGGDPGQKRDGELPLSTRTGSLLQSATHELDKPPFSGVFGIAEGPASAYAAALLDQGETTIKPVNANHLWIPIADNAYPRRKIPMSPSEAYELLDSKGKPRLRVFKSKRGNTVAFLADADHGTFKRNSFGRNGDTTQRRKGDAKGKLLFVLKDEVTVKGTDALPTAYENQQGFIEQRIFQGLERAVTPDSGGVA